MPVTTEVQNSYELEYADYIVTERISQQSGICVLAFFMHRDVKDINGSFYMRK